MMKETRSDVALHGLKYQGERRQHQQAWEGSLRIVYEQLLELSESAGIEDRAIKCWKGKSNKVRKQESCRRCSRLSIDRKPFGGLTAISAGRCLVQTLHVQ